MPRDTERMEGWFNNFLIYQVKQALHTNSILCYQIMLDLCAGLTSVGEESAGYEIQ